MLRLGGSDYAACGLNTASDVVENIPGNASDAVAQVERSELRYSARCSEERSLQGSWSALGSLESKVVGGRPGNKRSGPWVLNTRVNPSIRVDRVTARVWVLIADRYARSGLYVGRSSNHACVGFVGQAGNEVPKSAVERTGVTVSHRDRLRSEPSRDRTDPRDRERSCGDDVVPAGVEQWVTVSQVRIAEQNDVGQIDV
jgi:hypothetical protein